MSKYSNVRLSFVDLRWAQLYVSLVLNCIVKGKLEFMPKVSRQKKLSLQWQGILFLIRGGDRKNQGPPIDRLADLMSFSRREDHPPIHNSILVLPSPQMSLFQVLLDKTLNETWPHWNFGGLADAEEVDEENDNNFDNLQGYDLCQEFQGWSWPSSFLGPPSGLLSWSSSFQRIPWTTRWRWASGEFFFFWAVRVSSVFRRTQNRLIITPPPYKPMQ